MKQSSIEIIETLQKAGFTAYLAGGCVRDMLLGKIPEDFDIATSAKPEEIDNLLEKTYPIGKEFGVILTEKNGHHFEIASFRQEGEYIDGRRPSKIDFCTAKEDASRRDFTINGIFYDPINDEIHDFVNGQKDLKEKLINFIGDAEKRINEDHLRIIRAIRFKNTLEFQYEPKTYNAIKKFAKLSSKVSGEKLRDELNKMIMSKNFIHAVNDMQNTGILKEILPEIEELKGVSQPIQYHKEGDVWTHSLKTYEALKEKSSLELKWAALLHDIAKPQTYCYEERIRFNEHASKSEEIAKKILKRLSFPKKQMDHIVWLTSHHMMMLNILKMPKGKTRHWFLHPWFTELMELFRVDIAGTNPSIYQLYNRIKNLYEDFISNIDKKQIKLKPLLNGQDIMNITGLLSGPKIGEIIEDLHEKQLAHEIQTKEEAEHWIKTETVEKRITYD